MPMLEDSVHAIQFAVGKDARYYDLDGLTPAARPENRRAARLLPLATLVLGLVLGYLLASVNLQHADTAPVQLKWIQSPLKWFKNRTSTTSELYSQAHVDKFVQLRQKIDDDFQTALNFADAPGARYDPFRLSFELVTRVDDEFEAFLRELESMSDLADDLDDEFGPGFWLEPRFQVTETDTELAVTCEFPGIEKDNLNIDLKGQQLIISVQNRQEYHIHNTTAVHEAHFSRAFIVPRGVRAKDVQADLIGDRLSVVVQKPATAAPEPQTITVRSSA